MDPDTQGFLARAKRSPKKNPFADAVYEAFRIEFGITTQAGIAKRVGWEGAPRVSQVMSSPKSLDTGTIKLVIAPLKSNANKRLVIDAWARTVFEKAYTDSHYASRVPENPTEETLHLIDKLLIEGRIEEACAVSLDIASVATDINVKELAQNRHLYARFYANQLGYAQQIAQAIRYSARRQGNPLREAYAALFVARILLELSETREEQVRELLEEVRLLLSTSEKSTSSLESQGDEITLFELEVRCRLRYAKANWDHESENDVRQLRERLISMVKLKPRSPWYFWMPLLAARASQALGDRVLTTDMLDRARKLSSARVYHADAEIGLVHAETIKAEGRGAELVEFLNEQSWLCYLNGNMLMRSKYENMLAHVCEAWKGN